MRKGTRSSSAVVYDKNPAVTPAFVAIQGPMSPTVPCPRSNPTIPPPTARRIASMSTVARTTLRRAPNALMIATSRLRSRDEPTILTRMPIAETITTRVVTNSSSNSRGVTKRSRSTRISAIGSAACASRPSLIAFRSPIAVSSAGSPGRAAVSSKMAVTSR